MKLVGYVIVENKLHTFEHAGLMYEMNIVHVIMLKVFDLVYIGAIMIALFTCRRTYMYIYEDYYFN